MRPLARVQAEALHARGIDVLLVTTDQHPESDTARDYELVLDLRFRTASTWLAAQRRIREHRPDVVIAELVRDPRWIALAGRAPRIQLVHDERRDNGGPQRRVFARAVFDRWGSRSAATVTYSNYAAIAVATRRDVAAVCRSRGAARLRGGGPVRLAQKHRRGPRGLAATCGRG
jgi:hypothetical protein